MGEPCTGGSREIGQWGGLEGKTGGWNSVGKLGEGQTRRVVFLDIKGRYLVRCGCRGCHMVWCVAYRIY